MRQQPSARSLSVRPAVAIAAQPIVGAVQHFWSEGNRPRRRPDLAVASMPPKKKRKPTRNANRVTGTVDFRIRMETSQASAGATKMARKEALARANAFELWPMLTVANMSHNRLQALPRGCRGWQIMRQLNLAGNLLSELPDEFCTCSMLEGES